jgi:Tfp pilus assembly protein PilF
LGFIIDPVFWTESEGLPLGRLAKEALRRVDAGLVAGNVEEARSDMAISLDTHAEDPGLHQAFGDRYLSLGLYELAARCYLRANDLSPDHVDLMRNASITLCAIESFKQAVEPARRASELRPKDPELLMLLGQVLGANNDFSGAVAAFRDAIRLQTRDPNAWIGLFRSYVAANDYDAALGVTSEFMELHPNSPAKQQLLLGSANVEFRRNNTAKALDLLESMDPKDVHPMHFEAYLGQKGRCYDKIAEVERAYEQFKLAGEAGMAQWNAANPGPNTALTEARETSRLLTREWVAAWPAVSFDDEHLSPAFLLGFSRSGTTLLERVIDSHPEIQVLDERPALNRLVGDLRSRARYPHQIAALTSDDIRDLREDYFQNAARMIDFDSKKLLVDKGPLHTVQLPLIHRLFPDAKIIVSLRHPYDVCLSNFMQNFEKNPAMANFYRLEDAAIYYHAVMSVLKKAMDLLPLTTHIVKYEDVVADFEAEARDILDFLGRDWDDNLLDFYRVARKKVVRTASAGQVTRPIYKDALDRWRRYGQYFEPVKEILDPFVAEFGYSET